MYILTQHVTVLRRYKWSYSIDIGSIGIVYKHAVVNSRVNKNLSLQIVTAIGIRRRVGSNRYVWHLDSMLLYWTEEISSKSHFITQNRADIYALESYVIIPGLRKMKSLLYFSLLWRMSAPHLRRRMRILWWKLFVSRDSEHEHCLRSRSKGFCIEQQRSVLTD